MTLRRTLRGALQTAICVAASAALFATPAAAQDIGITVGSQAPSAKVQTFATPTAKAQDVDLSQYIGKRPVLLEFWAIWCPSCKGLEPKMEKAFDKYGKSVDFVRVAVSASETPAAVTAFVQKNHISGIQVYDLHGFGTGNYDVPATSYVVLIDKSGKIVYTGLGEDQDLDAALKKVAP